jgi:PAS domain S-box-containing protein
MPGSPPEVEERRIERRQVPRRTALDARRSSGQVSPDRFGLTDFAGNLSDPVFATSLDGKIRSWNAAAEQLYGYRAEEIIGKAVSILAPPERGGEIEDILTRWRRGEVIKQFDTVRRRKDGAEVQVSLSISPIRDLSGEIVGASVVAHDITALVHREKIQSFLAEASRLLAINLDYRETLSRVAHLTLGSLADWCLVEIAGTKGSLAQVAVAHRDPKKAETVREMRRLYPANPDYPDISLRVRTTGKAELIAEVSDALLNSVARNTHHLQMLHELGPNSLIVVPLRVSDRVLGTILLAREDSARRFSADDLQLAEDLGRRAALAIDNSTLHRSEREARHEAEQALRRISGLQSVTAALSGALTPTAVAKVFVHEGAAAVGASGGFVRLLTPNGRKLRLAATVGYSRQFNDSYRSLALTSPLPGAEVFRTGAELYFESAAAAGAASPEFAREQAATGHEAIAFVALHIQGRPVGLMALSFALARTFDDGDRELLKALAGQCSQALERARLFEAERKARAAAEDAIESTTRLQSLAAELAEALTPQQVAEVAVTQGIASVDADAGALHLLTDDGGTLELVNGKGSDLALIGGGWRRFSIDLKLPSTDALHTLEPVFIESEKDIRENYPHVENDPHALDAWAGLHARAGAHIPLVLSGRPLGVLFLGFSRPRRFSAAQREFVLALGRQCAQALKRAQLYEAELEGRARLSRLVERLHEGVVSVDRRGRVEFASSTAKNMLSAASLEEGRPVPEAWFGFPLRSFAVRLFEDDVRVVEAQIVSQDGERVFDVTGIPAARTDAALLVVSDVSERARRERAEREFVDNAAHELRTPLAAITSAIERLQAGAREVPEKRDRFLDHIQRESTRLNRLASSLLVLARAQTREEDPRREEIPLHDLLEELVGGIELKQGVELVLECPPILVATSNRDLLEHALLNLLTNAARHTDRGRICVSASVVSDRSVMIEISDTGSGIPRDQLSRLFDRFYRGPNEEGRAGFGLGLPITKEAVEALGGRVEIDSVPGDGTTARIVLPCAQIPTRA